MLSSGMCLECESYVAGKPVVSAQILIIGNFIYTVPKLLIYSILAREKFIYRRFALHNSEKSSTFAENFKNDDEKQAFDTDDRSNGSLSHGELQCAEG